MMLYQIKLRPNDSVRPLSYNNVTDKNKMAATKEQWFLRVLYWSESSPTVIQSPGFTNDCQFYTSVNKYQ